MSVLVDDLTIVANGDASLFIVFEPLMSQSILAKVKAAESIVTRASLVGELNGIVECVPAYHSLMVNFDLGVTNFFILRESIAVILQNNIMQALEVGSPVSSIVDIPTCYDPSLAADLETLADFCQLSVEQVVRYHSGAVYTVYMLGFMPGFLYLGGLDACLQMPRKPIPEVNIPQGSVGIAGQQTGVYPFSSPGGWQIIGRTPLTLFDVGRASPALAQPSQQVRFVPISLDEFYTLSSDKKV